MYCGIVVTRVCLSAAACPQYCRNPDVTWALGGVVEVPPSCALLGYMLVLALCLVTLVASDCRRLLL